MLPIPDFPNTLTLIGKPPQSRGCPRLLDIAKARLYILSNDVMDRILLKCAKKALGVDKDCSAHSMRTTFITTALKNGVNPRDVQVAVGHADPSTTKLYDRRGYNPEKAASLFANY